MEKVFLLKRMPLDLLQHQIDSSCPPKELPHASVISSIVAFQNHIIMCDLGTDSPHPPLFSFLLFFWLIMSQNIFLNCYSLLHVFCKSWAENSESEWRIWPLFKLQLFKFWDPWITFLVGPLFGESLCSVSIFAFTNGNVYFHICLSSVSPKSYAQWFELLHSFK